MRIDVAPVNFALPAAPLDEVARSTWRGEEAHRPSLDARVAAPDLHRPA